jgi:hypothetical protein
VYFHREADKRMTKPNSTLILAVIDRSGSMGSRTTDVIGGFDKFVEVQAKEPGECKISLYQFDDEFDPVWTLQDIRSVPSIGTFYSARGSTALNDAVAKAIIATGKELAARPEHERPSNVIVVIVTDGAENASVEYKGPEGKAAVKKLIQQQTEKYNWKFTYLGANVDAFAEAQGFGIAPAAAMSFSSSRKGVGASYLVASNAVLRSRRGLSMDYNAQERAFAADDGDTAFDAADADEILKAISPNSLVPDAAVKSAPKSTTRTRSATK